MRVSLRNYKVSWKELKNREAPLVYYAHQSHAYIKAYALQHLRNIHLGSERLREVELVLD